MQDTWYAKGHLSRAEQEKNIKDILGPRGCVRRGEYYATQSKEVWQPPVAEARAAVVDDGREKGRAERDLEWINDMRRRQACC